MSDEYKPDDYNAEETSPETLKDPDSIRPSTVPVDAGGGGSETKDPPSGTRGDKPAGPMEGPKEDVKGEVAPGDPDLPPNRGSGGGRIGSGQPRRRQN